jgi:hypothetical protein
MVQLRMIKFIPTPDGYVFTNDDDPLAFGVYEGGGFSLIFNDTIQFFANPTQAFCHLRSIFEPKDVPCRSSLSIH